MAFPPSRLGRLAQLVERTLGMCEVGGSKPSLSKRFVMSIVYKSVVNEIFCNGFLI